MTNPIKSLLIKGRFDEADMKELAATLRNIERRQPDQDFWLAIIEADLPLTDGKAMVERIFPRVDDDDPTFTIVRL